MMDLALTNPGGSADSTVVNLRRFHLRMGANPVDASLVVRTPVSDPNVDLRMKGKVDLADVRRTVKLDKVDQLTGTIAADAAVKTRMSAIDKQQYDRVAASGTIDIVDMTLKSHPERSEALPCGSAFTFSRRHSGSRRNGPSSPSSPARSAAAISGRPARIDNLISYAFRDDTLKGSATVQSNHFDLDEWRSGEGDLQIIPVPPKIDFGLNATVKELTFDKLKMTGATGKLRIKDQRATLQDFRMNTLGGQIVLNGSYDTKILAKPAFDVGLKMVKIDIPSAFQAFTTVQMFAPVAKYASGTVNTDINLSGALGKNMMPLFSALTGKGIFQSQNVALREFPRDGEVGRRHQAPDPQQPHHAGDQDRISDQGRAPGHPAVHREAGRHQHERGGVQRHRQTMDYTLGLRLPKSLVGGADQAIAGLASKAGFNLGAASEVPLNIGLTGKITDPSVKVGLGSVTSTVASGAQQAVTQAVTQKVDSVALRAVAEAEKQAAAIRQQGGVAGRAGEADRLSAGRLADGEGGRQSAAPGRGQGRGRQAAAGDRHQGRGHREPRRASGPTAWSPPPGGKPRLSRRV